MLLNALNPPVTYKNTHKLSSFPFIACFCRSYKMLVVIFIWLLLLKHEHAFWFLIITFFFSFFSLSEDSIQFGLGFPFWRFHCTFIRLLTLHLLHLYGCKLCLFSPLLYLYQRIFLEECILFSSRINSIFPAPILSGCNFSLKLLVSN